MDTNALEHLTNGRIRRDVQGIRDSLAEFSPGANGRVVVYDTRYGMYIVDGLVRKGASGQLMIAHVFLGTTADIQRIYPSIALAPYDELPLAETTARELGHGNAVRVTFSNHPHGTVQITGPVTAGDDRFLMVGPWIIRDGDDLAPRVVAIERFEGVLIHQVNTPARRPAMSQSDA